MAAPRHKRQVLLEALQCNCKVSNARNSHNSPQVIVVYGQSASTEWRKLIEISGSLLCSRCGARCIAGLLPVTILQNVFCSLTIFFQF